MATRSTALGHAGQFGCVLILVVAIWLDGTLAIPPIPPSICGASYSAIPADCGDRGFHEVPSGISICPNRIYCKIEANEKCRENDPTTICRDDYMCYCGFCQKDLILCPQKNHFMLQWLKRIQRNDMEYNI